MVVDFLVTVNVVHDTAQVLLTGVGGVFPLQVAEETFSGVFNTASANSSFFNANVLDSDMLVVAKKSQTLRKNNNRVSFHNITFSSLACMGIEIFGIIFVGHSGSSVINHLDFTKDA